MVLNTENLIFGAHLFPRTERLLPSGCYGSLSRLNGEWSLLDDLSKGRNAASAASGKDANSLIIKSEAKMDTVAMLPFGNDLHSANGILKCAGQCERRFNLLFVVQTESADGQEGPGCSWSAGGHHQHVSLAHEEDQGEYNLSALYNTSSMPYRTQR
ncbi:hypothetical protein M513_03349 [Trichuris suis]|uniref:Uncharacterized protein n=1 Tax=Trichuris suis TaxID=68888 RepID=A0A085MFB4_9BILA|nr:hypothetical protein M513_03349 [Trichuris suis]